MLGVGEGELDVLLGVGEGELGVALGVPDEDGDVDVVVVLDALGLDEGLPLAQMIGEKDPLLPADPPALADDLADLNSDAEESASAAAGSWFAALFVADASVVLLGMSRHFADLVVDWLLASAVCNSANKLHPMNAKPTSAPTAAGLSISALTCESSCAFWLR